MCIRDRLDCVHGQEFVIISLYKGGLFLNLEEVDILYTPEQIREKVKDLGSKISVDYKGESLLVVCLLYTSICSSC